MDVKLKKVLPLIIMAAFVAAAAVFLALHGSISVEELLSWSPENKWLAALVALAAYAVKSQTVVIPYALIAAAVGLVFDLPLALCINALGSVICISVPYLTGRGSDGVLVDSLLGRHPRICKVYEENKRHLFLVSLVLRVTNLSNDLLGLFFGSLRMKYGEYLLSSFIGILPAMVLYTVLGRDLDPLSAPVLICLGVDVLSIALSWLLLRRRHREDAAETDKTNRPGVDRDGVQGDT